jgi:hypothetical protein
MTASPVLSVAAAQRELVGVVDGTYVPGLATGPLGGRLVRCSSADPRREEVVEADALEERGSDVVAKVKGLFCVVVPGSTCTRNGRWPWGRPMTRTIWRAIPPGSALASDIAGWRAGSWAYSSSWAAWACVPVTSRMPGYTVWSASARARGVRAPNPLVITMFSDTMVLLDNSGGLAQRRAASGPGPIPAGGRWAQGLNRVPNL